MVQKIRKTLDAQGFFRVFFLIANPADCNHFKLFQWQRTHRFSNPLVIALNDEQKTAGNAYLSALSEKDVADAKGFSQLERGVVEWISKTFERNAGDFRRQRKQRYVFVAAVDYLEFGAG